VIERLATPAELERRKSLEDGHACDLSSSLLGRVEEALTGRTGLELLPPITGIGPGDSLARGELEGWDCSLTRGQAAMEP
jgi:hypothetical protein